MSISVVFDELSTSFHFRERRPFCRRLQRLRCTRRTAPWLATYLIKFLNAEIIQISTSPNTNVLTLKAVPESVMFSLSFLVLWRSYCPDMTFDGTLSGGIRHGLSYIGNACVVACRFDVRTCAVAMIDFVIEIVIVVFLFVHQPVSKSAVFLVTMPVWRRISLARSTAADDAFHHRRSFFSQSARHRSRTPPLSTTTAAPVPVPAWLHAAVPWYYAVEQMLFKVSAGDPGERS